MESKKRKKSKSVLSWVTTFAALFLTIGVMTIFPACGPKEDGTWMNCHFAQLTVFGLALLMTVLSFSTLFTGPQAGRLLYVLNIVCALLAAVLPGNVIHLCMMNEMQCRSVMRPSVILMSVILIALSLICIAAGKQKTGRRKEIVSG